MTGQTGGYILKLSLTFLLVLPAIAALSQVDMKHSLPELTAKYAGSKHDSASVKLALTISNFYRNNRGCSPANVDSSLHYGLIAESVSRALRYKKGLDDAGVAIASGLILQKKFADVQHMVDNAAGSLYCRLQILLGRYFLEKPGEEKSDLDKADSRFAIVQYYTSKHQMPNLSLANDVYRYNLMLERGLDSNLCNKEFNKITTLCQTYKNGRAEARIWFIKSANAPSQKQAIIDYNKTSLIARAAGDTALSIRCLKEIADVNLWMGNLDTSEIQLKRVLKMYSDLGYKNIQYVYDLLAVVSTAKGDFETAMRYGLAAVSYSEKNGTEAGLVFMQLRLAQLCRDLGQKKQSIQWYQKCLETSIRVDNIFRYSVFRELASALIAEGKAKLVLRQLATALQKYPPDYTGVYFIPMLRGDCYAALNQPIIAERFYLQVIDAFEKRKLKDAYYYWAYRIVASFYIQQKAYDKAALYLERVLGADKGLITVTDLATVYQLKFKADSAKGDYLSAIKHFEASKSITDSIFNKAKLRQTEQLQLQFETARRDRENLVLRNKNTVQKSELEKEGLNKKMITMALLGSVLVIGLMVYLYQAKQRSNTMLKFRQDEINKQNLQLNQLLLEKEWLMKEIHHRVKNNLQIISSLLNTQSSYLDNEDALTAIRDSQNRMQAISIVHQKLYQSDDLASINLQIYIEELARSIQDSFQDTRNVKFNFNVAEIRLTTADTVPLGLILNEAITNSVKYAFAEGQQGIITISMFETMEGRYQLSVSDNGKGLPDDFDVASCSSLGINLMIGLTEQLSGKFSIGSNGGTLITILFHPSSE
jgi:two-component sensor histidine kinase